MRPCQDRACDSSGAEPRPEGKGAAALPPARDQRRPFRVVVPGQPEYRIARGEGRAALCRGASELAQGRTRPVAAVKLRTSDGSNAAIADVKTKKSLAR
jgi:hypothetical protein